MKENLLIKKLFEDLYDGEPWLDVNIVSTLKDVTAEQAAMKVTNLPNSIWEIVNHVIQWRETVLKRMQGEALPTPANNYFEPVSDTSKAAWKNTMHQLHASQDRWLQFLDNADPEKFSETFSFSAKSRYEHIHGIIQHDAYHLGQTVMIARNLLGARSPSASGDGKKVID